VPDNKTELGKELAAIEVITTTLEPLSAEARSNVIDFVFKRLGIVSPTAAPQTPTLPPISPPAPPHELSHNFGAAQVLATNILSLKEQKQPKSVNEMVALVAYYLARVAAPEERRDYIVAEDITKYFNQGRFRLPEGPARMALTNAKNAGYLEAKERGQYRLSPVGHNLVDHRLGTEAGEAQSTRRKKRKPKPKASAKAKAKAKPRAGRKS
jgi:hypothetical protein